MKKLSSKEKNELMKCLDRLDKISGDSDIESLKDELSQAANLVSDITNKIEDKSKQNLDIQKMVENNSPKLSVVQRILEKANEKRLEDFGDEFEEQQNILDQNNYIDMLKAAIEINQQAADIVLAILENSLDENSKNIKKVLDANIENKRILKNVYKNIVNML